MTFAVLNEVVDQQDCHKEHCKLETVEVERHLVAFSSHPTNNDDERKNQ